MSTSHKEYKDSYIKKLKFIKSERKEKEEEIISIPHQPLKDESIKNKKSICDFVLKEQLGEGTFGYVRLAINKQTGEKVAIKILEKKKILEYEDRVRIEKEIKILKTLRHPNIIHLYSVLQTKENIYLIMEYAKGIELFEYIGKKKRIEEIIACQIYQQIISGLEYLHKTEIVHRDIKPENLIINKKTKELKIVDFGLSNIYNKDKEKYLYSSCGSPSYAAPEMLKGRKYKPQLVDVWSSGIVLFAMICGYLPFEDDNNDLLYKKICIGKFNIPDFVSNECKDLLKRILVTDPNKRITIKQIKNHPWFQLYKVNGKLILYEGLLVNNYIIPVDEEIIEKISKQYDINSENIRLYILNNKHNDLTTLYYLFLLKKINSNIKSVADLKSDLFKEYIKNKNNYINKENCNTNNNNQNNKEMIKDINNKTNYNLFNHNNSEENKKLNLHKKRPVSYGQFNYNSNLKQSKKNNELNNSKDFQNQISEQRQFLKPKRYYLNNDNDFNEEEEYRQRSETKKKTKKGINIIKTDNNKQKINTSLIKNDNEKLQKILSSLKKEIKNNYLVKNNMKEENERNSIKTNDFDSNILNKKVKHSYFNHLLSNRKKIFNTIDWDENYQTSFKKVNKDKKYNKNNNNNNNNNISLKNNKKEISFENNNEELIEKNKNNMTFNLKKLTNNNNNTVHILLNNSSINQDKYIKKQSKNNISIIKARNDTFSKSVIKSKYKPKYSLKKYNNKYNNMLNSKSPVKTNKSSLDVINSEYEHLLTQNNNNTYNYNEIKSQSNYKRYLNTINEKDNKSSNKKNEQKLKKNRRDCNKLISKINEFKNLENNINKNSYQKFNLYLQSSFNEIEELNNNIYLNKNTENCIDEKRLEKEDNSTTIKNFEPIPLSNIYITSKHYLKKEIDTILEELNLKYKNNGFSYIINNDKNDRNSIKLKIKSYYNPPINIIQFSKNEGGKYFFTNIINKIQSKLKNI